VSKYPREWPGFRVILGGWLAEEGAIIEGVELDCDGQTSAGRLIRYPPGHIGGRILSGVGPGNDWPHPDGWLAVCLPIADVEPLTPTAREWKRCRP
jgi:hypothetical protein